MVIRSIADDNCVCSMQSHMSSPSNRVVEDHVRGHALLLGRGRAPGPQLLEQGRGRRGQLVPWAPRLLAARAARARGGRSGSRRSMTWRRRPSTSSLPAVRSSVP